MLIFKTKVGARGQVVIPKVIRENLGIVGNKEVVLELDEKILKLRVLEGRDIAERWEAIAKTEGCGVKKLLYGDKLYEEIF